MGIGRSCNKGPCAGKDPVETLTPVALSKEAAERVTGFVPSKKEQIKRVQEKQKTLGLDKNDIEFKERVECLELNYNKQFHIDKDSVEQFANVLNDIKLHGVGYCVLEQKILKDCLNLNKTTPLECSQRLKDFKNALEDEYSKIPVKKKKPKPHHPVC